MCGCFSSWKTERHGVATRVTETLGREKGKSVPSLRPSAAATHDDIGLSSYRSDLCVIIIIAARWVEMSLCNCHSWMIPVGRLYFSKQHYTYMSQVLCEKKDLIEFIQIVSLFELYRIRWILLALHPLYVSLIVPYRSEIYFSFRYWNKIILCTYKI